jgi:Fe-S cluster assembly protein SufB
MADLETIELVKDIDVDKYKYGFETEIESDVAPKGLNEDIVRLISAKKDEPAVDARLAARCLQALAQHGRADLGQGQLSQDRFPGPPLLRGAEIAAAPKSLDEVDPASCSKPMPS